MYASDIAKGPLDSARRNAERYGVADKIEFRLADGIDPELAPDINCIIIAGMGGETIAGILERADSSIRRGTTVILSPHTKLELLLTQLESGYSTPHLTEITEGRRKYTIITASRL